MHLSATFVFYNISDFWNSQNAKQMFAASMSSMLMKYMAFYLVWMTMTDKVIAGVRVQHHKREAWLTSGKWGKYLFCFYHRETWSNVLISYLICVSNLWSPHQTQIYQFPMREVACPSYWISFPGYSLHYISLQKRSWRCPRILMNYSWQTKRYCPGGRTSGLDSGFYRWRLPGWERHNRSRWHRFSPVCESRDSSKGNGHLLWDPRVPRRHWHRKTLQHLGDSLLGISSQAWAHHLQHHWAFLFLQC